MNPITRMMKRHIKSVELTATLTATKMGRRYNGK